jgi:hypothetical protein
MAYHEHMYNGHLVRRHYNGHRFTEKPEIQGPPPVEQHNDPVYENRAKELMARLQDQIGNLQFDAWLLRVSKPNVTWRDLLIEVDIALKHPDTLDCACQLPEEHCSICDSLAHVLNLHENNPDVSIGEQ